MDLSVTMEEGRTPQFEPMEIVPIPNPNGDESQQFLVNGSKPDNKDGNHNDPELRKQRTVINLNNYNVRMTIWCIIYIIWTSYSLQYISSLLVYYQTDSDNHYDSDTDKELQSLRLNTSFNVILWWAAAIILCNLYCTCCTYNCIKISAVLFLIGGILAAATLGDQLSVSCGYEKSDLDHGYCKEAQYAGFVFPVLFSFYMAIDAITLIGNNIRVRMSVSALLIAARSFLAFLYYRYDFSYFMKDADPWNKRYDAAAKYSLQIGMGFTFSLFFWCIIILFTVMMGYCLKESNPNGKLYIWIKRIVGCFIIGSASVCVLYDGSDRLWYNPWWYWLPACCLLAYDVQYM